MICVEKKKRVHDASDDPPAKIGVDDDDQVMNIYIDIYVCVIHINRRRLDYRVMSCNMSSCIYGSKLPTILPNTTHLGAASRQPSFSDISMDYIQLKPVSSTPDEGVPETKNHHRAVCERKKNTTENCIHINKYIREYEHTLHFR